MIAEARRLTLAEEKARRRQRKNYQFYLLIAAIMAAFTGLAFVCGAIFGPAPKPKPIQTEEEVEVRNFNDDVEVITHE